MKKNIITRTVFAVICLSLSSTNAMAQVTNRGSWFPNNNPPALSPWLELERATSSELDSYHQFVRPRLEMERMIQAQQRANIISQEQQQILSRELMNTQQQMSLGTPSASNFQMNSGAAPTGKGATYRNYMHYYPNMGRGFR